MAVAEPRADRGLPPLNLAEWVVLALLDEEPQHGFAVAKKLDSESDLGRVLTVHVRSSTGLWGACRKRTWSKSTVWNRATAGPSGPATEPRRPDGRSCWSGSGPRWATYAISASSS